MTGPTFTTTTTPYVAFDESIWTDSRFLRCSTMAKLLWLGIRSCGIVHGEHPRVLRARFFPAENDVYDLHIKTAIKELVEAGLLGEDRE